MPTSCAAFNCSNRFQKGGNISFHRFPFGNPELLSKWVTNIKREHFKPTKSHAICSEHFEKECFLENYCNIRKLKSDAVPTLFNFPVHLQKTLPLVELQDKERVLSLLANRKFGTDKESNDTEAVFHKVSVRHDHDYGEEVSPTKLKRKYEQRLERVQGKLESSRKKLRLMRKQCQRRDIQVISLSELLAELKKHSLLNELGISALENKFTGVTLELFRRSLQNTKSGYNDILRSFALTLHFNSPKAYEYVRQSLGLCLPHPDTLRRWYCCVSGKPGFTAEAIEAVKKSAESSVHPICIALMMDEMSTRKGIEWDGKEFVGYADLGFDAVNSHGCEAKEVCVIIAVGINTSWKIPIAYFLIHLRFLLNKHNGKPPKGKNLPLQLQRDVLNDLPVHNLFLTLHEHAMESDFPENHIIVLIKLLIPEFLKVRMYHIGKMCTEKLHATSIRQKLNKAILFSYQ